MINKKEHKLRYKSTKEKVNKILVKQQKYMWARLNREIPSHIVKTLSWQLWKKYDGNLAYSIPYSLYFTDLGDHILSYSFLFCFLISVIM